jgi:hypothetical protein
MAHTQITTWRRFTAAEKKAYRARQMRRRTEAILRDPLAYYLFGSEPKRTHHFADNLGSRVPTMRVNGDVL